MGYDRRGLLTAGLAAGVAAGAIGTGAREASARSGAGADDLGLVSGSAVDQAPVLQIALDAATERGAPLELPAGHFRIGTLKLRSGARLIGAAGATVLEHTGGGGFITAEDASDITIEGVSLDGAYRTLADADGLIDFSRCTRVRLRHLRLTRSPANGIALAASSGSIADCVIDNAVQAAIRSLDATGLEIIHND
ncbi:MAG TPA: TIGR03808 family TAT-translocated repetitive protein, partial [Hyphomicrobium sp.]|nr:TIGR03808 family TAT-translocated repetitive protein [Hyphomicrobium sp.]